MISLIILLPHRVGRGPQKIQVFPFDGLVAEAPPVLSQNQRTFPSSQKFHLGPDGAGHLEKEATEIARSVEGENRRYPHVTGHLAEQGFLALFGKETEGDLWIESTGLKLSRRG